MAENLILECKDLVTNHIDALEDKKSRYNIYRLLNVTNKEVQMCRILADLLDPEGAHGEGAKYLIDFFAEVLHKEVSDAVLQDARVYKEYPITNDRRIDIVIRYHGGFIPIEVKINADDQKSQCYDYYNFAKKKDQDACIVYLTRSGYRPSEYSVTGSAGDKLDESVIHCISFEKDILSWLERIKHVAAESMVPFIDQFAGAVQDFVNTEDEEYKMKLTERIIDNSENLRTSLEIANTVNYAKAGLMRALFVEFEKQMEPLLEKYHLTVETKSRWFHYEYQATEEFYSHNESTYPGLNYVISSVDLGEELSLWLRIEIDNRLFGSLCVFDYSAKSNTEYEIGNQCDVISDSLWDKLCEYVILPKERGKDGWIVAWKYLPTGSDSTRDSIDSVPDFKKMNEAAIELADEDKRKEFVSRSIKKIEDTLLSLIRNN